MTPAANMTPTETLPFGPPIISCDVEDWPQSTFDHDLPVTERSARNTQHVLDVLAEHGVRGTMFVLGLFAEKFPEVVRRMHAEGHEVGCHTYNHYEVFHKTPSEFAADTRRVKDVIEQTLGERVRGYRAADFSIVRRTLWGLEVLAECGFDYDSSIFPVDRPRYGIPTWPRYPTRVELASGRSIVEFPIAAYRRGEKNYPVGGGGYHRLLPGFVCRAAARKVMHEVPFVFYCHPYEFDPREFAEVKLPIPWKTQLHQGLGRSRFEPRFRKFLKTFGGQRFVDLVDAQSWPTLNLQAFEQSLPPAA